MTDELKKEFDKKFTYITHCNIEDVREWINKNFTPNDLLLDKNMVEPLVNATLAEIPQKWTWFDLKSWNYQIYDDLLETIENEAKTYPIGDMGAIALWKLKDKISKCSL